MAPSEPDLSPAAADRALEFNLERLRLITANRNLGATWAMIGHADGRKTPKIAKRDYKRAARQAGQQWRLQRNQEDQPPDATRTPLLPVREPRHPRMPVHAPDHLPPPALRRLQMRVLPSRSAVTAPSPP